MQVPGLVWVAMFFLLVGACEYVEEAKKHIEVEPCVCEKMECPKRGTWSNETGVPTYKPPAVTFND